MADLKDMADKEIEKFVEDFVFNEDAKTQTEAKPKEPPPPEFVKDEKKGSSVKAEKNTTIMMYKELFGWDDKVLKGMDDFEVQVFEDDYWDADDLSHVPDLDKFEGRVVDHRAMYPFVMSMQPQFRGMKTMLVGPTGSGKSTLVEYYCAKVNHPFLRINGRQDMESDSIIGRPWASDGEMKYLLGEWPKATQKGWMTLVDEPWKIPSGIWMTAQRHLERGGIWQLDDMPSDNVLDKQIVPKSSYRCVLADNVVGTGDNVDKYGATMIQDGSTLNRIDVVIQVPYLEPKEEVGIITGKYPKIAPHMAKKMVAMLNLLRSGYDSSELSSPASIRNIEAWSEMAIAVGSYEKAFEWVLLNRYADDEERGAVRNHYMTCFGKRIG